MADFDVEVTRWVEKAKKNMTGALRAIAEEAVAAVKARTPVRTGYLRANWTATINSEAIPKPVEGGNGVAKIQDAVAGDIVVISNPVRYARRIEYGFQGVSPSGKNINQPGRGMVQQTVAEIPAIAERVVRRFSR
jgi:Bacteriophage HK97-gp10, putative tail-component